MIFRLQKLSGIKRENKFIHTRISIKPSR